MIVIIQLHTALTVYQCLHAATPLYLTELCITVIHSINIRAVSHQ